ncbi:YeeE/YedE family protein [Dankookia sp. GCM10030260]|uniref:YeeE/YedE family protein n=1 Tax=Dankookia sp. GCM10030260 TaxID=3273390 RepID=UPI0036160270
MTQFTPWSAAAGGALIGAAAALLWVSLGRIAGISGILGGLAGAPAGEHGWRLAFLAGLVGAPLLYLAALGAPEVSIAAGPARLVLAGLLVGVGTRLGTGCTSGHGVCGIARLSPRSIAATGVFMATAAATVFLSRHVLGS